LRFFASGGLGVQKTPGFRDPAPDAAAPSRQRHNALIHQRLRPIRPENCNGIGSGVVSRRVKGKKRLPTPFLFRAKVVVDAKWKDLAGSPLLTHDIYQVLAYCTALGVGRGVLVYPGRRSRAWDYEMMGTPIRLTVCTVRVVGDREACTRSLRRLGRALR